MPHPRSPNYHQSNKPQPHELINGKILCTSRFFLIFLSSFLSRSNRIGFLVDDNGISKSAYGLPEHFLKVQNG